MIVGYLLDRALIGAAFYLPADAALQRKSSTGGGQRATRACKPRYSGATQTGMHHDPNPPPGNPEDALPLPFGGRNRLLTRSGRVNIVKSASAVALSARLGPVMQGGKPLARDSLALTLQADLRTKAFTAVREGDILLGTCD